MIARSPRGQTPHLSTPLFLLLLLVASSPHLDACVVVPSENGTSVTCHPPAQVPGSLPDNTVHLVVEFLNLTQLPAGILVGAPDLRELHLSSNRLENLSVSFLLPVPRLQVLDLTRNALSRLPPGLFRRSAALHTLVLKENRLVALEGSWLQDLRALEHLDVSGNQLGALPAGLLANLTRLRILDLSSNQLEALPPDLLQGPVRLERLHLEGNRLRALGAGLLTPQPDLSVLFLGDNQLSEVAPGAFHGLRRLDMLDLSNNSLSRVPEGLWASLGQPGRDMGDGFDLSRNPWVCDQSLHDLYGWLLANQEKMFSRDDTRCAEPVALRGQTLLVQAQAL